MINCTKHQTDNTEIWEMTDGIIVLPCAHLADMSDRYLIDYARRYIKNNSKTADA